MWSEGACCQAKCVLQLDTLTCDNAGWIGGQDDTNKFGKICFCSSINFVTVYMGWPKISITTVPSQFRPEKKSRKKTENSDICRQRSPLKPIKTASFSPLTPLEFKITPWAFVSSKAHVKRT